MGDAQDKENVAPQTSSDPLQTKSSATKARKGRSKSIGPGDLSSDGVRQDAKQDAKNRRKSTYVPATKSIIGATDEEKAKRQAERRKTLANRRVSFAPEATLHTWDVIEFMRDQTTSTDSDQTRRSSLRSGGSPTKRSRLDDDGEPPSTPPEQEDEPDELPAEPEHQRDAHKKQRRRSSGIQPMNFNNPGDFGSSSGMSGSSDGEESGEESEIDEDATGTAMSLDTGEETAQSLQSTSSTSSSGRLDAALRQAALAAGTRGIEYDEHGDGDMDVSETMDIAGNEITNAFKPWAQQRGTMEPLGSASLDQENVNPFSPAFKAQMASGLVQRPSTVREEDTGDLSMDVTKAVGGIMRAQQVAQATQDREDESLLSTGDGTMELTQPVGKIHGQPQGSPLKAGQKRRRQSTTETGSPGAAAPATQPKRRRSSVARPSMGDETMDMDLTMAVGGGIQKPASPAKSTRPERRRVSRRRSSGVVSEHSDSTATMDFTQAVGGVRKPPLPTQDTATSFDENEELTMELTTVLGGIKAGEKPATLQEQPADQRPVTPQNPSSPAKANTTPKDQERFLDVGKEGPPKLLTPLFQKTIHRSAEKAGSGEKSASASKRRKTLSPAAVSWTGAVFDETASPDAQAQAQAQAEAQRLHEQQEYEQSVAPVAVSEAGSPRHLPLKEVVSYPVLPSAQSPGLHPLSPGRNTLARTPPSQLIDLSPRRALQQQLDVHLQEPQPSPMVQKMMRSSPLRQVSTPAAASPERPSSSQDVRKLTDSIKLMNTPRKEPLKTATPKKVPAPAFSPVTSMTPRGRPTPKARVDPASSPARQLSDDLIKMQASGKPVEKVQLQAFLEQANIRFMDISATKRRMTAMPTPSKTRNDNGVEETTSIDLGSAVVAAACSQPEHDMFQHACHELKHYISEGKKVIKQLEAETYQETPPLIAAYMNAPALRKAELDTQMRDMKTEARSRSKEMWYAWRSQLLEDLMKALSGIGKGMIKDDDLLSHAERALEQALGPLQQRFEELQAEAEKLQAAAAEMSDEQKEELEQAREQLVQVDADIEEKQRVLAELQSQAQEQESIINDLRDNKSEFSAAIQEAERVREACRGVSVKEIAELKASIKQFEDIHNWSVTSLSASGTPTMTMIYKSQLQLFFHPDAFLQPETTSSKSPIQARPNSPISLTYIARDHRTQQPKDLNTTLRFFLQLLRASLHAIPQCSTTARELLHLVSGGWDTALQVAESERRLNLECITESRIVSDERLAIECNVLLHKVRTKIRIAFELEARVGGAGALEMHTEFGVKARVVYGEKYDEKKMAASLGKQFGRSFEGWEMGVRELRRRLAAQGTKGLRR